jgi:GntR family transcriptional regulator, transcriptional repressor for pyruvate dehydrogenase complex
VVDTAPIERRNVYQLVAENLVREIAGRRLRPGDPLPTERELTEGFRVGRSSVREALRMLESRGLIQPSGRGGFAVSEYRTVLRTSLQLLLRLEEVDLRELYETRRILEVEVAGLAAARRRPSDLVELRTRVGEMERQIDSPEGYVRADVAFHRAIGAASGNRTALHLMDSIRGTLHTALLRVYEIPGSPRRSLPQHRLILGAIAERNPSAARERMRAHLERVEREIVEIIGEEVARRDD